MKRSALKRGKPLKRAAGIKPRVRPRMVPDRMLSEAWAKGARAKRCAVCNRAGIIRGHHVLYQQWLNDAARVLGLTERETQRLLWDGRNRMPLCDECHERHHKAMRPIRRHVVRRECPKVTQFAREIDDRIVKAGKRARVMNLAARLDSTYPE